MLSDMSIKEFLNKTASSSPVPGGGSVAALSASISAALSEMVANLTIGKKKYENVEDEMKELTKSFSQLRDKFMHNIDKDADAFDRVMRAFKLPKDTEEEKKIRKVEIQEAFKEAALVPLDVAKEAFEMMPNILEIIKKGNKNAVTDGAVSAMLARTAVLSALYNVKINLGSIKDEEFVEKVNKEVKELEDKVVEMEKEILKEAKL
ncbi:cyclodeaminase/cyclohydrolase family protein [Caldisalinibacter kiritimatiensis]|uniref:Formiminotetrahydrofolate cyclodeaminase n=1 Tax=Caldisalinibacter kiritimatiensis TaxID=1304284 RepID=R1CMR9_9FIRM|nr:cyclodeaminase/cyclohydrolase family protein [Caldisalinibacter kiritimatiensis]EOC99980.1 Formiminotetrahydrofolate cyclodeaminase [Caldisalinibacter kiritimatiensis]